MTISLVELLTVAAPMTAALLLAWQHERRIRYRKDDGYQELRISVLELRAELATLTAALLRSLHRGGNDDGV